jgi:hypothetical protein
MIGRRKATASTSKKMSREAHVSEAVTGSQNQAWFAAVVPSQTNVAGVMVMK